MAMQPSEATAASVPAPAPASVWRRLALGWQGVIGRFAWSQTTVMLGLFYALLIGPTSLVIALARRDYLGKRGLRQGDSAWLEADTAKPDLERAKLLS